MNDGRAYYNEHDPYVAQWLRNLIAAGYIAPGDVDERSIEDVIPNDIRDYTQVHLFAGIGGWSLALRLAGWPDSRPVWTGSCPCQPFSSAGKGNGFADERHLWPAMEHLIRQRRPAIIFGEQVASKDSEPWIDLVHADMEALDYAFGCVPFPSAGVGAPHIRDRLYWMADADSREQQGIAVVRGAERDGQNAGRSQGSGEPKPCGDVRGVADTDVIACEQGRAIDGRRDPRSDAKIRRGLGGNGLDRRSGPLNGFWRTADWLLCRDGKWRPVRPGTQPLAHGIPNRVGRLRAYGNAINPRAAEQFIRAYLDVEQLRIAA